MKPASPAVVIKRSLLLLSVACGLAVGCASPAEEATGDSADAISHEDAAKEYDFAEKLFPLGRVGSDGPSSFEEWASPAVAKLGVVTWAAYSASKGKFVGLVLFATDKDRDVKYVLLVNAARAADGKAQIAALELDKSGKKSSPVSPSDLQILKGDMKQLNARIRKESERKEDSDEAKCVKAVARVTIGLLVSGTALVATSGAAWGAVEIFMMPALANIPAMAGGTAVAVAGGAAPAMAFFSLTEQVVEGTKNLDLCR